MLASVTVAEGAQAAASAPERARVELVSPFLEAAARVLAQELGEVPTRRQVPNSTAFLGGEGIWYQDDVVYFATKGDNRVWAHNVQKQTLDLLYDDDLFETPQLTGVDNIVMTDGGDIVVVEDKAADQEAIAIRPDGTLMPLIQLDGQAGSEVTGPAFSPDGRHFYFSSQRGPNAGSLPGTAGETYCVTGDWFLTRGHAGRLA